MSRMTCTPTFCNLLDGDQCMAKSKKVRYYHVKALLGLFNQPSRTDSKPCACSAFGHSHNAGQHVMVLEPFISSANCITSCREIYFCRAAVDMQESGWGNGMAFARSHLRMAGSLRISSVGCARFCSSQHRRGAGEEYADWVLVGK